MKKNARIDLRIPEKDKAELERLAAEEGRTISNLVTILIQRFLSEDQRDRR